MPRGSRAVGAGGFASIDFSSLETARIAFGAFPAEIQKELRPKLLEAAQIIADAAQENASFSSWIPGAIQASGSAASGAVVKVDSSMAPAGHEPLPRLEEFGVPTWRHPVFGSDNWVDQEGHPFLFPAVRENADEVRLKVAEAVREAAAAVGLI